MVAWETMGNLLEYVNERDYFDLGNNEYDRACLGRHGEELDSWSKLGGLDVYRDEHTVVQDLPTGLVPFKEFVFSPFALFGKEHNEFEWSLVDNKKGGIPIEPFYCVDEPQETQVV